MTGPRSATASASTIRFFFDYISSNAYLAWQVVPKLADQYGMQLEPVPVLFAGLLKAHGQLGPAEVPVKAFCASTIFGSDREPTIITTVNDDSTRGSS